MATFTGSLNPNQVLGFIYNMILRQVVMSDNIKAGYDMLANEAKEDVGLLGDQALYYATDALESFEWTGDGEAANLLKLHRPDSPECQAITIDTYRIIPLTLDAYLTKQAWSTEGAFQQFNDQMLAWIAATKKIHEVTIFNTRVGTIEGETAAQNQSLTISSNATTDNGVFAREVAQKLADILADMKDYTRDYNDYGFLRSYAEADLRVVFNSDVYNRMRKVDLPVIFHKEGILDDFDKTTLPAKYFGNMVGASGQSTAPQDNTVIPGTTTKIRSLVERRYTVASEEADARAKYDKEAKVWYVHVIPGDLLPNGVTFEQNEAYYVDETIAFKIVHKKAIPFLTAFSAGTVFWNPRSLTNTHYSIFGYAEPQKLYNYPVVTVKMTEQE